MKSVFILILVFFITSCAQVPVKPPSDVATEVLAPVEVVTETPAPVFTVQGLKIGIKELKGFSTVQEKRFREIVAETEKTINSEKFKASVRDWYHKGKKQFFDTTDTNEQVLAKILSYDWVLEYRLEKMRIGSSVIGYTYPDVTWIVINARKWSSLSDAEISGNICHEYGGHKLGRYKHEYNNSPNRPFSVPYGVGYLCRDLFKKHQ